jgi:hypothetical protein
MIKSLFLFLITLSSVLTVNNYTENKNKYDNIIPVNYSIMTDFGNQYLIDNLEEDKIYFCLSDEKKKFTNKEEIKNEKKCIFYVKDSNTYKCFNKMSKLEPYLIFRCVFNNMYINHQ